MKKVLIATPTSTNKDYIFLDWFIHTSNFTYPNKEIIICDNSHDITYHEKLKAMGVNCLYVAPKSRRSHDYITESQNVLRDYFLKGNYDYFFSLEVDIFPPRNIIEKLLTANKKIVAAPYFWNFGKQSQVLLVYFRQTGEKEFITHEPDFAETLQFFDGNVNQIYENGIGCTLISREIIEKIPFRVESGKPGYSDTYFYIDLFKLGYKNWMDTSVFCKHYNSDWGGIIDNYV
jgi:hypothetical protein